MELPKNTANALSPREDTVSIEVLAKRSLNSNGFGKSWMFALHTPSA